MKSVMVAVLGCFLVGCASPSVPNGEVQSEKVAIEIGRKACREKAGDKFFEKESMSGWKAQLTADHWKVWWGPYYALSAYMEISVAKADGKTTDCIVTVS